MSEKYQSAVIIGASIAGLVSAQILSRYFERITIIERDELPEGNEFRSGAPQNRQPHLLMKRGLEGLDATFPGFSQQWQASGAVSIDFGHNVEWSAFGRWRPKYEPGLLTLGSSRPLLEGTLRRRLLSDSTNVVIIRAEVTGLVANGDNDAIVGVRLRDKNKHVAADVLQADLVLDTSGRSSHTAEWLETLGYGAVRTSSINAFPGYASRIYERPSSMDSVMVYIQPAPPETTRGAVIAPLEVDRIHVCLIGMAKDYPPTDDAEFMRFLASLSEPRIYRIVKDAKPLSSIAGYRRAENVLKHYDEMKRWPENFVALGDAVYAFNPVYGQGMTVAIMAAQLLGECLQAQSAFGNSLAGMSSRFQKELIKLIEFPWQLATGEDMRWMPVTEGCPKELDTETQMRLDFLKNVMVASTQDPVVTEAFYRVLNMVATPDVFLDPAMMARTMAA